VPVGRPVQFTRLPCNPLRYSGILSGHALLVCMARNCTVCTNPSRRRIDRALLEGISLASCARRFNVGADALGRHLKAHVQAPLRKHAALEREVVERGSRLKEQLEWIAQRAEEILVQAQRAGNLSTALRALAELRESAKLLAVSTGELEPDGKTQVNIAVQNNLIGTDMQVKVCTDFLQRYAPERLASDLRLDHRPVSPEAQLNAPTSLGDENARSTIALSGAR
jgi:hypothetical protein